MAHSVAAAPGTAEAGHTDKHFWALVLGSLGVVFGDIGTSPLYALREAVKASTGGPEAVPGILSLMVWTMLL
ncbi:MAG TPA: KUP/HAK/KT family potassium transporter, partial [Hyphomicrobiaceae bacterium]|nr:KUP/HAK/KT family potassium transporter [Hyphomicrobiaceae bacterium]